MNKDQIKDWWERKWDLAVCWVLIAIIVGGLIYVNVWDREELAAEISYRNEMVKLGVYPDYKGIVSPSADGEDK